MKLDRRNFLSASSALMLFGACQSSGGKAVAQARKVKKVGIQTYTLREAMADDFVGTLQMVKDVGYDYVELNGQNLSARSPIELNKILNDIGLPAPIIHVDYDGLANRISEMADIAATLKSKHLILPWVSDDMRSADDFKKHAEMLNRAGDALVSSGVGVGYHNHHFEFDVLENKVTGMEILLSETDPKLVDFEIDFFWAAVGNVDILNLFERHPGRFKFCHVKDMSGEPSAFTNMQELIIMVQNTMVNVGEGDLPFESYFEANDTSGLEYVIVEHDLLPKPYRESISASRNALRAMRF